jgi:hypothetical protein
VNAPDPFRLPSSSEKAYSRAQSGDSSLFFPDRDTRRVPQVEYDDPFSPSLTPFKRLSAFDAVNADATLRVADPTPKRMTTGGAVLSGEDAFYGDVTVDLVPGEPVRIPSVGPGARVLRLQTVPQTQVELLRDGAENLFLRGTTRARVRALMELSAPRLGLGGPLRDALWNELPSAPALPKSLQADAEQVAQAIGVSRAMSFRDVVEKLVGYYRSFSTTDDPIPQHGDVFLDIALSKKGVCRHRAFAFVVTALGLKIPARLVTNEAHAWVEVSDGTLWHRIDLGGAADNFADSTSGDKVPHEPPADPFAWPAGASPGRETARQSRPQNSANGNGNGSGGSSATSAPSGSSAAPSGSARPSLTDTAIDEEDARPRSTFRVDLGEKDVLRNAPIHLQGKVDSAAGTCAYVRVDVILSSDRAEAPLGSLATDADGNFQGAVIVPPNVAVGDYDVILTTPGDSRCGKGRSE